MADVDVSLGLKAQELLTELQGVTAKIRSFADEAKTHGDRAGVGFSGGLQKALGGIKGFFSNITHLATSTLGAIGIGLGVGVGVHEVKSVIEFGAHIEDLSRKTGVNAEVLSRWGFAAQKAGGDIDGLAKFIGFLEVNREKAAKGGNSQLENFKALGITAEQIKDPLFRVNDLLIAISKGSLDPAALKGVGGKGALENRTLLAQVGQGDADLDKSISATDTAKLKALEDSFINLKQVITVQLAPAITAIFTFISKQSGTAAGHIEAVVTRIKEAGIQISHLAKAAADAQGFNFVGAFKELKAGRDETKALETQLAPKLLPNPDPDQGSVDDAKSGAGKPRRAFDTLVGGEDDAADKKLEKKEARNDREARKLALDQLGPQERLVELLKEAAALEKEKDSAKEGSGKIAAEKEYLDVLKEIASTKKELERDVNKNEKEHERDLKEEVKERLGASRGGRGRGGQKVDQGAELDRQQQLDDALARDEADRRAHGSYTGPGGGEHSGLVTGHVQSSGGLKTNSINPLLTDDQFHAQFQRGSGTADRLQKDGLGSLDDFHKQFQQTHGLSRSDEAKRAVDAAGGKKEVADPTKDAAKLLKEAAAELKKALTNQQ
jgi:hypothetical protein